MLNRFKMRKDQSGFTIIEVLIVLAIAGLIMVVVFLAVPNLQKSQRNNARKTDANNILSSLSNYVSNNGGALPTAACTGGTGGCTFLTGVSLGYYSNTATNITYTPAQTGAFAAGTAPTSEQVFIYGGATCTSAAATPTAGTSARQVAIWFGIEGSVTTQCISE